jgi:CHAT domain-containing protein
MIEGDAIRIRLRCSTSSALRKLNWPHSSLPRGVTRPTGASESHNSAWQVTPYTSDHALKEVMDRLRSPGIVHVTTHGFFLSDQQIAQKSKTSAGQPAPFEDPMLRSGLFFAGAERIRCGAAPTPGLDDGALTAYEAGQLDLENTELVVLSACETGLRQQSNSEGVFGLRRGLQEAGADAVMMSTWSVSDRETQELMGTF